VSYFSDRAHGCVIYQRIRTVQSRSVYSMSCRRLRWTS